MVEYLILYYNKELIQQNGLTGTSVDDLVAQATPKARELVPDAIKRELVQKIRVFLIQQK